MAVVIRGFEQLAEVVAERTAELLSASVWIVDERGVVIASSLPYSLGLHFESTIADRERDYLRVPVQLGAQPATVVVATPADGEAVSPRLGSALVSLMINQATLVAKLPNRAELKNKFIHDLLRGRVSDEADIIREGQMLGMDLTLPRAVILIDAADYILASNECSQVDAGEARIPRRAQFVIASVVGFFSLPTDTICAYISDGEVAVLKASSTQDLVAWTDNADDEIQASSSWANLAALKRAATLFVVGNGGSAATASHFACDLAKGTRTDGVPPFRVMPLTDNVPLLTAWANDTSYDHVFAEQLSALVRSGDVVIAISASGNSPNVLAAAELARLAGATVIALTGQTGGRLRRLAHITVRVPAEPIEQVEDAYLAIAHSLCVALRQRLHALRYDGIAEAVATAGESVAAPVSEFLRVDHTFESSAASS